MMARDSGRILVAQKTCDRCGYDSVVIDLPRDRSPEEIHTGDDCRCPECELQGTIVLHGATPASDDLEDTFDVSWIDPDTGEEWRV